MLMHRMKRLRNVRRLNAIQDPFGSAWLNVVVSTNLGLKMTNQQLCISLYLRLGACESLRETHLLWW